MQNCALYEDSFNEVYNKSSHHFNQNISYQVFHLTRKTQKSGDSLCQEIAILKIKFVKKWQISVEGEKEWFEKYVKVYAASRSRIL